MIATPPTAQPQAGALAFHPRWARLTLLFLVITTALRLLQLPTLELVPDEAYYWDWSRHPALGYYDQGPLIAYLIRLTTTLFGVNEFGVRFGVLALSLGTLICCYHLARRCFSPLAGFLTVVLLGLTPLMEVGSIIATYDPPLVFFWALAIVCLERALFAPEFSQQRRAWLYAGIATGLGFLSKHTMVLLVPCLLLFLALSPRHRFWLARVEPYGAFALTLLLYSGVFWWNAHHHWWTFGHLLFLTAAHKGEPLRRFGDFLGSQAALLGPGLFLGAFGAWRWAWSQWRVAAATLPLSTDPVTSPTATPYEAGASIPPARQAGEYTLFLLCMGLPVFAFFCLLTLKSKVQGNWAPCAWLTTTVLLAGWLSHRAERSSEDARKMGGVATVIGSLSALITLIALSPDLRFAAGVHLSPDGDLSNTAYGWRRLAARLQQERDAMAQETGKPAFLIGSGYQYCAEMAFYLPDHPETQDMFLHFRLDMYAAYVDRLKGRLGQDAIFLNDTQAENADLHQLFDRVQWEPTFPIWRRPYYTEPIRTLYIGRCYRFHRYIGLQWAKGG